MSNQLYRCGWARHELDIPYHDNEWGLPVHDDRILFEFLILEGFQAGLSWTTVLVKRDHFRKVLDGFDPEIMAKYEEAKFQALLADPGIIRNRLKVYSTAINAQAFLKVQAEFGTFDRYIWQFTQNEVITKRWKSPSEIPAKTAESDAMSKDLKKRGFKFIGSTICYAFMQAVGMVNDHELECFRHAEVARFE